MPWAHPYAYPAYDVEDFEHEVERRSGEQFPDELDQYVTDQDVLGFTDIAAWQRQMNTLKQVPVSVAHVLVRNGLSAISHAQSLARSRSLPGGTTRTNVARALKEHEARLATERDPNVMYAGGDDLKKQVLAAYIEDNAAEEGAGQASAAWSQMWSEIGVAIAALPVTVAEQVNKTAGALLGMPVWVLGVGALGILGVAGYAFAKAKGSR